MSIDEMWKNVLRSIDEGRPFDALFLVEEIQERHALGDSLPEYLSVSVLEFMQEKLGQME